MTKTILALSLAATALAGTAAAQGLRPDANGDGVVTRAEAIRQADARFAAIDANRDGKVTPEERRAAFERTRVERAARVVTKAEFQARAEQRFDRLDVNDDGKLTGDERRMGRRGPRFGMRDPGMRGMRRPAPETETAAEFRTRALARFDRIDANRDGRVDRAERAAARGRMGPPPGGPTPPPPAS